MLGVASHLSVAALESFAGTFHMPVVIPSAVEPTPPTAATTAPRRQPPPSPSPSPRPRPLAPHGRRPAAAAADDDDDRSYAIYVRPAYDGAIFALVRHFDWKHLYYLYDTEQGRAAHCPARSWPVTNWTHSMGP